MNFTHFNEAGRARMVEITEKGETNREAVARGRIRMKKETIEKVNASRIHKGDVLSVAQIAGIMGAKKTGELIPMCHPLLLTGIDISFQVEEDHIDIECSVKTYGRTGVEMEALTGVSITALTIYDMCKAIDKEMILEEVYLYKKTGGKSGDYIRRQEESMDPIVGKVSGINISKTKGVIKDPIPEGLFIADFGLKDDAHAGKWHRQVSLLAQESIDKMTETGIKGLCSGKFAENITTTGIILHELPVGTKLKIGETIQEISQIGKECHTGCEIKKAVGQCIMPKEGIFTRVIQGGIVKVGDEICLL